LSALPKFITFTGVDDETDPVEMLALGDDYPGRVEWGILFSPKRQGVEPRYPSLNAIEWLVSEIPQNYSAHLCGADARAVINAGKSPHDGIIRNCFMRAQINTADKVLVGAIEEWGDAVNVAPILQCRGPFPADPRVDWLFDKSGGRGIEQSLWPQPMPLRLCGYAGGLRPENVAQAVFAMSAGAAESCQYWIDMETGVRDERDRFSVAKCRAVCEAVYGVRTAA
jgi:hypothetical protein